jgi:hypothetical protein
MAACTPTEPCTVAIPSTVCAASPGRSCTAADNALIASRVNSSSAAAARALHHLGLKLFDGLRLHAA